MPSERWINWIKRYWPMLVAALLALSIWSAVIYDHANRNQGMARSVYPLVIPWTLVFVLALSVIYLRWKPRQESTAHLDNQQRTFEPRPGLETNIFTALKTEFENNLSWSQKLALCLIYKRPYTPPDLLRMQLLHLGFERDINEHIVTPMKALDRKFIELAPNGDFMPNAGKRELVEYLLAEFFSNLKRGIL